VAVRTCEFPEAGPRTKETGSDRPDGIVEGRGDLLVGEATPRAEQHVLIPHREPGHDREDLPHDTLVVDPSREVVGEVGTSMGGGTRWSA
jgi:hypothetical protein